jgi:hypothetical protein
MSSQKYFYQEGGWKIRVYRPGAGVRAFFPSKTSCLSTTMDFFRSKASRVSEISDGVRIPAKAFEIRLRFAATAISTYFLMSWAAAFSCDSPSASFCSDGSQRTGTSQIVPSRRVYPTWRILRAFHSFKRLFTSWRRDVLFQRLSARISCLLERGPFFRIMSYTASSNRANLGLTEYLRRRCEVLSPRRDRSATTP